MREEKSFKVSVTITFTTNVEYAPIERETPITTDDALASFYGYGLSEVIESGEYDYTISRISVEEEVARIHEENARAQEEYRDDQAADEWERTH